MTCITIILQIIQASSLWVSRIFQGGGRFGNFHAMSNLPGPAVEKTANTAGKPLHMLRSSVAGYRSNPQLVLDDSVYKGNNFGGWRAGFHGAQQ